MVVTLDSRRRLTVPASLVKAAPGDHFEVRFDAEEDAIVFRRVAAAGDVSWLLDADVLSQPARRYGDALVVSWRAISPAPA